MHTWFLLLLLEILPQYQVNRISHFGFDPLSPVVSRQHYFLKTIYIPPSFTYNLTRDTLMEPIFSYIDYRLFMRDYFAFTKGRNSHFSLKVFADRAGFKARDYILRVMNGDRNLSRTGTYMLSQAMRFSEKEASYFEHLVAFNQARTIKEKDYFFKRLQEVQLHGRYTQLREDQYSYLSQWYHGVIRSLLPVINFKDDFKRLGNFLDPPITESQARKSVELLLELGLVRKRNDGTYEEETPAISTGDQIRSVALAQFHKRMTELSSRSIDSHGSSERAVTGVTMSLSEKAFEKVKTEMSEFRKRVMNIAADDNDEERVYQLNLHLFPVTRRKKEL